MSVCFSATHRDLDAGHGAGAVPRDLCYRLDVVSLTLPGLDRRREDIPCWPPISYAGLLAVSTANRSTALRRMRSGTGHGLLAGQSGNCSSVVEHGCALTSTSLILLRSSSAHCECRPWMRSLCRRQSSV